MTKQLNENEDYRNDTPCMRNVRYGYVKFINMLDDVHWRVTDELSGIEKDNNRGGFFKRRGEWINTLSTTELSEMSEHITQIKKLMKKDKYDKHKHLRLTERR